MEVHWILCTELSIYFLGNGATVAVPWILKSEFGIVKKRRIEPQRNAAVVPIRPLDEPDILRYYCIPFHWVYIRLHFWGVIIAKGVLVVFTRCLEPQSDPTLCN